jgi:hypothetical protein
LQLEPLATLPDWLVQLDDPDVLLPAVTAVVPGVRDADLHGLRFKSGLWRGDCALRLTGGDETRHVLARIHPPSTGDLPATPTSPASPGTTGWRVTVPGFRLELAASEPEEAALPALAVLTDPARARNFLEAAVRTGTPAYPDLRILALTARVMRYSPGSRCTVLYELELPEHPSAANWPRLLVAKTYHRSDKGQTAWEGMRALWTSPLATSSTVTIAEPLAWLPDERILVQGPIRQDGTLKELLMSTLSEGPDASRQELRIFLGKTAAGLAELHGCGVRTGAAATWHSEISEVRDVLADLTAAVPELIGATDELLDRLERRANAVPEDEAGPAHRSFRPAQVLLDGDRIGFIDFDGFCQAEPALDLALFRATLRDVGMGALPVGVRLQERLRILDELCEHFLDSYQALAPVSTERVALWEALDLLTNVLHSWTKVKPERLTHAFTLLRHHVTKLQLVAGDAPPRVGSAAGS